MSSPNVNTSPQPEDTVILRGALQIETALHALRLNEVNPDLQLELDESLQQAQSAAEEAEQSGVGLNYTWFKSGPEGQQARTDILESLIVVEAGENELALAAQSLKSLLVTK